MGTASPAESSGTIPVGRRMLRPTTKLPKAKAKSENVLLNNRVVQSGRNLKAAGRGTAAPAKSAHTP